MVKDRKLGLRHWIKVLLLILAAASVTWYAKRPGIRVALREHGAAVWVVPTPQGLSSLIVLGDDGIDSNFILSGMRFWFTPPVHPKEFERKTPALYRGPSMAILGTNLAPETLQELSEMVDTGGILFSQNEPDNSLISKHPIRFRAIHFLDSNSESIRIRAGSDVVLEPHSGSMGFKWNGYRIRWWENAQDALLDTIPTPISLAIISQCLEEGMDPPHALDSLVKTLVYCGGKSFADSSRIALNNPTTGFTLIEDRKAGQILARRIHFLESAF